MSPSAPVRVTLHDSFSELPDAARSLMSRTAQPYFFDRMEWLESLVQHCLPNGRLCIALANDSTHSCIYPFRRGSGGTIEHIANWYSFRADPVFSPQCPPDVASTLLTAVFERLRHHSRHISLFPVAAASGMAAALRLNMRATGWTAVARPMGRNRRIIIPSGTSFEAYWQARPGQLRSTFARKSARYPVEISIKQQLTETDWADVLTVFERSWKDERGDNWTFLHDLAMRESSAGTLRLGIARLDGRPVAVDLWTVENGTALIHKLAYDEEARQASPGTQLSHAMFAAAIDIDKVRTIDFGTGDTGYKALWMPDATDLLRIDAWKITDPRCWIPAARAHLSAARGRRDRR